MCIFTSLGIVNHFVPVYFTVRFQLQPTARKPGNKIWKIQLERGYYVLRYHQNSWCVFGRGQERPTQVGCFSFHFLGMNQWTSHNWEDYTNELQKADLHSEHIHALTAGVVVK